MSFMNRSDSEILEKLIRLIENNVSNSELSLETIYKELGVSKTRLYRIVKEHTQLSTTLYIRSIRLEKAKQLLDSSNLRMTEIASSVGIDSPQNFSKYFIQAYGLSPTEYRKRKDNAEPFEENKAVVEEESLPAAVPDSDKTTVRWKWIVFGVLAIIVVIIGGAYWIREKTSSGNSTENYVPHFDNSIAILPFRSLNNNPSFADGVLEGIHSSLSLIENLKVISQSSSNQYRNTDKTNWQIGDELQVAYVLKGTVKEQSNQVETVLSLIRTQDDIEVWSQRYEGDLQQLFNLMNGMVKDIATQLSQKITPSQSQQLERVPTRNLEAYNEFLLGRTLLITRTKEKLNESLIRFNKALALDTTFAEAQAYKSIAYLLMGNMGYEDLKTCLELAEQHALKAIQLDTHNSTAYATLGNVYRGNFKWQQSKTAYEISLKYRPNDAQTIYWYSLLLRSMGQLSEALRYSTKAVSLDPLYPVILSGHIWNCAYANRDDLAQKALADGKLIFDDSFVYYMARGEYELHHNRFDKALKEFTKMEQLNPNMKYGNVSSAFCTARLGNPAPTRTLLNKMGNQAQDFVSKSMLYAGLGQKDSSLFCLEKAASMGRISSEILVTPMYRAIRKEPRFQSVLKQFGLPASVQ
ncbi:MAG: helix-turn-helix domain-containing protein [Bacteroidetes bacterium]|nr:helix-turn-helix domain-containing protein [Bacteroidota bacterium]